LIIDAYFSATKIKLILENVQGAELGLKPENWLLVRWFGWFGNSRLGKPPLISQNASRTMLFNIHTKNGSGIIGSFVFRASMLPAVKSLLCSLLENNR
jgi:glycerol kinase